MNNQSTMPAAASHSLRQTKRRGLQPIPSLVDIARQCCGTSRNLTAAQKADTLRTAIALGWHPLHAEVIQGREQVLIVVHRALHSLAHHSQANPLQRNGRSLHYPVPSA